MFWILPNTELKLQIAQIWCQSEKGILSRELSCWVSTARHAHCPRRVLAITDCSDLVSKWKGHTVARTFLLSVYCQTCTLSKTSSCRTALNVMQCLSVRTSVCPSRSYILLQRIKIYSNFFNVGYPSHSQRPYIKNTRQATPVGADGLSGTLGTIQYNTI